MKKELLIVKRKKAKELSKKGYNITKISRALVAGRDKVRKWLQMTDEEITEEKRGWKNGKLRKHNETEKDRVIKIKNKLKNSFFQGPDVVVANYKKEHKKNVSRWFVTETLRKKGLTKIRRKKQKGGSRYMNYPEIMLSKLGKVLLAIDFMGPKYLKNNSDGKHFLSCKYIRPIEHGIVKIIKGQTTDETLETLLNLWQTYPIPDAIKIDNDKAFGGNLKQLGRFTKALLRLGITPIYSAPRCPWNNGSVESFNSVFAKNFWKKIRFLDEEEMDVKIKSFNFEYQKFSELVKNNPKIISPCYVENFSNKKVKITKLKRKIDLENVEVEKSRLNSETEIYNKERFRSHEIYLIRKVEPAETKNGKEKGVITIYSKEIKLPIKYINLFTLSKINLKKQELKIFFETKEKKEICIKTITDFKI